MFNIWLRQRTHLKGALKDTIIDASGRKYSVFETFQGKLGQSTECNTRYPDIYDLTTHVMMNIYKCVRVTCVACTSAKT